GRKGVCVLIVPVRRYSAAMRVLGFANAQGTVRSAPTASDIEARYREQILEAILLHQHTSRSEARRRTVEMLARVGLDAPDRRFDQYPHELSGGMRQRVVIAMALVCRPELLIADEPTTALDVTLQAQILGLIRTLQREIGCSVLLITHDFGVVAQMADDVAVMHHGRIVERGPVRAVLQHPQHPYTRSLLEALPSRRARVA
ncbi:MAG: ABC transporter ATP-binding protein, partial [Opitutales bacterium]|nr:ABC transporter ATP-binding protein [Opitutales bacterium]